MKRAVVIALALAIVAVLVWQTQLPDAPPSNDHTAIDSSRTGNLATSDEPHSGSAEKAVRTEVVTAKPETKATAGAPWTIAFEGIDPAVPWTAPVQVVFEGRFDITIKVDADGIARFVPPPAARHPGNQTMRVISAEPNYRFAAAHGRTDHLQAYGSMSFQVYPIARLQGRVLDAKGKPTTARVRAYPSQGDGPGEPIVGFTMTSADGTYDLQVPPTMPVLVIADVEAPVDNQWPSFAMPLDRFGKSNSLQTLAPQAQNPVDPTVLPATARAVGTLGEPTRLADLKLRAAAKLTGTVKTGDGTPVPLAIVTARPAWAGKTDRPDRLHWSAAHGSVRGGSTTTDQTGSFTLDLLGGTPYLVRATSRQPALLAGVPKVTATAPGRVDLVVPGDWMNIRVEDTGTMVFAWIDIGDRTLRMRQASGLAVLLPPGEARVRARFGDKASDWVDIPAANRPTELTLELNSRKLPPVNITARNAPDLREVHCFWQPLPSGAAWSEPAIRANWDLPFTTHVPVGRYELTLRDVEDAQFAGYLVPQTVQVDVTAAGCNTEVDLQFGGGIELAVRDGNGTRLAGTFKLTDSQGKDVTPATLAHSTMFPRRGKVGELLAINTNQLSAVFAPGTYTLVVNVPGRGTAQRDVTVEAKRRSFVDIVMR